MFTFNASMSRFFVKEIEADKKFLGNEILAVLFGIDNGTIVTGKLFDGNILYD